MTTRPVLRSLVSASGANKRTLATVKEAPAKVRNQNHLCVRVCLMCAYCVLNVCGCRWVYVYHCACGDLHLLRLELLEVLEKLEIRAREPVRTLDSRVSLIRLIEVLLHTLEGFDLGLFPLPDDLEFGVLAAYGLVTQRRSDAASSVVHFDDNVIGDQFRAVESCSRGWDVLQL